MSLVSISGTSTVAGVTYYHVDIRLPLRALAVQKRYNDFVALVEDLCDEIGISVADFPHLLPPKRCFFYSQKRIVEERTQLLTLFMNGVVEDRDLQNRKSVHRFFDLPKNFKFTPGMYQTRNAEALVPTETAEPANAQESAQEARDLKFVIDDDTSEISAAQWLAYLRMVRYSVASLSHESVESRVAARELVNNYIKPNVAKLAASLAFLGKKGLDDAEKKKRTTMLQETNAKIGLFMKGPAEQRKETAAAPVKAEETAETIPLSNKELLQQQEQIHKQQDEEVEELRKLIARQREIGLAINHEVEEQNEILDSFGEEVEQLLEKLRGARARARKVV